LRLRLRLRLRLDGGGLAYAPFHMHHHSSNGLKTSGLRAHDAVRNLRASCGRSFEPHEAEAAPVIRAGGPIRRFDFSRARFRNGLFDAGEGSWLEPGHGHSNERDIRALGDHVASGGRRCGRRSEMRCESSWSKGGIDAGAVDEQRGSGRKARRTEGGGSGYAQAHAYYCARRQRFPNVAQG
jgi:hypothetical protein